MVKIKKNVDMTLPELIEWAWENDVKGKSFNSKKQINALHFDMYGGIQTHYGIEKNETFTVEVEEEITEETILEEMFMLNSNTKNLSRYTGRSIASVVKGHHAKAFYIKDDDFNMTLIWKDGELVGDE